MWGAGNGATVGIIRLTPEGLWNGELWEPTSGVHKKKAWSGTHRFRDRLKEEMEAVINRIVYDGLTNLNQNLNKGDDGGMDEAGGDYQ